jgi:hypothetical protein
LYGPQDKPSSHLSLEGSAHDPPIETHLVHILPADVGLHHDPGTQLMSDKQEDPHAAFVPAKVNVVVGNSVVCGGPPEVQVVVEVLSVEVACAVAVVVGGAVE